MFVFFPFCPFDWLEDVMSDNKPVSVVRLPEVAGDARLVLDLKALMFLGGASLKRSGRVATR